MTTDIETAYGKWFDEARKGDQPRHAALAVAPGAAWLAFEAGWQARGRHDVDAVGLLVAERDHLILSINDIATRAVREGRDGTPRELAEVAGYVQQMRSIDDWLRAERKGERAD